VAKHPLLTPTLSVGVNFPVATRFSFDPALSLPFPTPSVPRCFRLTRLISDVLQRERTSVAVSQEDCPAFLPPRSCRVRHHPPTHYGCQQGRTLEPRLVTRTSQRVLAFALDRQTFAQGANNHDSDTPSLSSSLRGIHARHVILGASGNLSSAAAPGAALPSGYTRPQP